jgi:hypothetical protein
MDKAVELLINVVPDIQKTAKLVQEINTYSQEQHASPGLTNKAIQQLDQVIQHNTGALEKMAAAAEDLSSQTGSCREASPSSRSTREALRVSAPSAKDRLLLGSLNPTAPLRPTRTLRAWQMTVSGSSRRHSPLDAGKDHNQGSNANVPTVSSVRADHKRSVLACPGRIYFNHPGTGAFSLMLEGRN